MKDNQIIGVPVRLKDIRRIGGPGWREVKNMSTKRDWDGVVVRFAEGRVAVYLSGEGQNRRYEMVGPVIDIQSLQERLKETQPKRSS